MRRTFIYQGVGSTPSFSPPDEANLLTYWKMDEDSYDSNTSGFTDEQQSAVMYNSKQVGGTSWSAFGFVKASGDTQFVDDHNGNSNGAFDTGGIFSPRILRYSYSDYVVLDDNPRTICMWVKCSSVSSNSYFAYGSNARQQAFFSSVNDGLFKGTFYQDNGPDIGCYTPSGTSWRWMVLSYDGYSAKTYVDNVQYGEDYLVPLDTGTSYDMTVANQGTTISVFDMQISDIMIYDIELSSSSMTYIYENQ